MDGTGHRVELVLDALTTMNAETSHRVVEMFDNSRHSPQSEMSDDVGATV